MEKSAAAKNIMCEISEGKSTTYTLSQQQPIWVEHALGNYVATSNYDPVLLADT
jgi:hypothetical protein